MTIIGAINSDTVSISLLGSGNCPIDWGDGTNINPALINKLTKHSHTFDNVASNIEISNPENIEAIIIEASGNFTITVAAIAEMTNATVIVNIGTIITGDLGTLSLVNLEHLNTGNQFENSALTGDIGVLLSNHAFKVLHIAGGDMSYTSQTLAAIASGWTFVLDRNNLTDTHIDLMIADVKSVVTAANTGYLKIFGVENGTPTATSAADRASLISDGSKTRYNGIELVSAVISDNAETYTEGVAITPKILTTVPDLGSDVYYEEFGTFPLPDGLSFNQTTKQIEGTFDPDTAGDHISYLRVIAMGGVYTGFKDVRIDFTVSSWSVINLNLGHTTAAVANTDDPFNKYWNNITAIDGVIANMIDQNNAPTGIGAVVNFQQVGVWNAGREPNDAVYPDKVWGSPFLDWNNENPATVVLNGLNDNDMLTIIVLPSSQTTGGNRTGEYTVGAETLTQDSEVSPPVPVVFTNKQSSGGALTISGIKAAGQNGLYMNGIILIKQ